MKVRAQGGSALIAVLWILLLLAALTAIDTATTRTEIERTRTLRASAEHRALLESALAQVIVDLTSADPKRHGVLDGGARSMVIDGMPVQVSVFDEASKLNVNTAAPEDLAVFFAKDGVDALQAASLAARIADWRDRDDDERQGGAEAPSYARAGRSYGPRNAPIETLSELTQVLGIDRASAVRWSKELTFYLGVGKTSLPLPLGGAGAMDRQGIALGTPGSNALEGRIVTLVVASSAVANATSECTATVRITGNAGRPVLVLRDEC